MSGIKETKEFVVGVNEVGVEICKVAKDGLQVSDAASLYIAIQSSPELQAKLVAAFQGAQAIPAEVKDLDLVEGVELVTVQVSYVPKYIDALKGPA